MITDFRERRSGGQAGERARERNIYVREKPYVRVDQLPHARTPTGDRTRNLHMYPDQNHTCDLLFYRTKLQPNKPHQPGQPPLAPEWSTPSGEPLEFGNRAMKPTSGRT